MLSVSIPDAARRVLLGIRRGRDRVVDVLLLAYLFTEADLTAVVMPVLVMSFVLSEWTDISAFLVGLLWMFSHLVGFEIGNQIVGQDEDKLSKPRRPIPSGRITTERARTLYYGVLAFSVLLSWRLGLLRLSIIYFTGVIAYNEGRCARWWWSKSIMGACGYFIYTWGLLTCMAHGNLPSKSATQALLTTGLIFATTGQAQDFRDREGDAAIGRKTLPIVLPQGLARWSLAVLLFAWTAGLTYLWHSPFLMSALVYALAGAAAVGFTSDYSEKADRRSYWWYNVIFIDSRYWHVDMQPALVTATDDNLKRYAHRRSVATTIDGLANAQRHGSARLFAYHTGIAS
ncbi:UbiA prenyltransferase family-domain-containing protein, partial [Schizophyllum commune]